MRTLPHMETNAAEALGSRTPDATVILLITESTRFSGADHRAPDSTLQPPHRWPLCAWASVYTRETHAVDKETDPGRIGRTLEQTKGHSVR